MKKKILIIINIISVLLLLKFLATYVINEKIKSNYYKGYYDTSLIKRLYTLNFSQPYIAYYNNGNILFKKGEFDDAVKKYTIALKKYPPKDKICKIRINLSLSLMCTITENNIDEALTILKNARTNLYENNCAHEDDDGGNDNNAEKLEDEIKEVEEKFKNVLEENDESNNSNEEEEEKEEKSEENNIEEQLKEQEKSANIERNSELEGSQNMDDYEYYTGKNW